MRFFSSSRTRRQRRKPPRPARRPPTYHLSLELLEARCLLSHFTLGPLVQVAATDLLAGSSLNNEGGLNFPNTQVEPRVAVDPTNANHLVAAWQQDRWDNSGAQGIVAGVSFDGGQHWTSQVLPGLTLAPGTFDRASDPWVSIGPSGTVFVSSLVFNIDSAGKESKSGFAVSRSTDGGLTWSQPPIPQIRTWSMPFGTSRLRPSRAPRRPFSPAARTAARPGRRPR
jgi:hypothetical protein